jgi:steroid 5-alpha reductase family enzyme
MDNRAIRVSAVAVAAGCSTLAFVLLARVGAMDLFPWVSSPVIVPVIVVFAANGKPTQRAALAVLVGLASLGVGLLMWGLVWHPGDYNHLVALFLPIYQFAFFALGMAAFGLAMTVLWLVSLIRRAAS